MDVALIIVFSVVLLGFFVYRIVKYGKDSDVEQEQGQEQEDALPDANQTKQLDLRVEWSIAVAIYLGSILWLFVGPTTTDYCGEQIPTNPEAGVYMGCVAVLVMMWLIFIENRSNGKSRLRSAVVAVLVGAVPVSLLGVMAMATSFSLCLG